VTSGRQAIEISPFCFQGISTLKTFFGRPDQILDRLIEEAKRISVNKKRLDY